MSTYTFKQQSTPTSKRVKTDDALGVKSVPNGQLVGDILVEIDWEAIVRDMGAKALRSKGHKCRDGYVVVKARNVKHVGGAA